jgi:hypothetical protein
MFGDVVIFPFVYVNARARFSLDSPSQAAVVFVCVRENDAADVGEFETECAQLFAQSSQSLRRFRPRIY